MSRRSRRKTTVDSTKATQSLRRQLAPAQTEKQTGRDIERKAAETPAAAVLTGDIGSLQEGIAACARSLGLTVRPACEADAHSITQAHTRFEIEQAAWTADETVAHIPDGLAAGIRQIIQDEGGERIMLLTRQLPDCSGGGEIIGFVYSCDEVVRSGTSCYIAEVFVEPSERGQGLGDLLVSTALASALSRGTSASHLYVCHRNAAAVQLYEKHGFKSDGESGDPTHDVVMVNAAVSPDAVRCLLEQRQARNTRSRRRARVPSAAASTTSATRNGTGRIHDSLMRRANATTASSNDTNTVARSAPVRARQRAEESWATNSNTGRALRQPCADLAENIARHRVPPVDQLQRDSESRSIADTQATAAANTRKPTVWVRPRPESPATVAVEQPAAKKMRRQTTTRHPKPDDTGSLVPPDDHKLRALKQNQDEKIFSLSGFGMQPERLQRLESILVRLGGKITRKSCFDNKCTHVIVSGDGHGSLRRTEKMLGALASGRPLLTENFIEASDAAGAFVDEDGFECRDMFPALLPTQQAPCFSQVCAVVLGAGNEKRLGLQRILQAGGGTIFASGSATPTPVSSNAGRQPVTHVILPPGGEHELNPSEARQLRHLQRHDASPAATVLFHNNLVDYLTSTGGIRQMSVGFGA